MRKIDPDVELVLRALNDPERDALQRLLRRAMNDGMAHAPRAPRSRTMRPRDGLRSRQEAAAKIGCSVRTLDAHVASGALRYVSIGRGSKRKRRMFTDDDLNAFIEAQSRKDAPCPSTRTTARRTSSSISGGEVIAFSAAPRPQPGAKRKG
jgi:hypothetical protein